MIKRIGEPLHTFKMATGAYRITAKGNRIYTVAQGKPCVFYVIDADNAKELASFVLEGSNHSWGICMAPDGSVYMGGDGYLYHYNPVTEQLRNCGIAVEGETYFWRLAADDEGHVYGGTYPGGKVFQYNPKTDTFRDYGNLVEDQYYARCMDMGPNQKLYVGIGIQKAYIIELDVVTGEKTILPTPPGQEESTITYDLDVYNGYLFARYADTMLLHIYHLNTKKWVKVIEGAEGYDVSSPDEMNRIYFMRHKQLHSLSLDSFELQALPLTLEGSACDFGWLSFSDERLPGLSLVTVYAGGYAIFNPQTNHVEHRELAIEGTPTAIQSMTFDNSNRLHIGGYFTGGYAYYDVENNRLSDSKKIGQSEQLYVFKDKLYFGVYPGSNIFEYDYNKSWVKGENPKQVFSLYNQGQDRPFAMTSTENCLVVGTVPNYGKLGGALAFYNPDTSELNSYVNIVENQSIIALYYKDGIIYGGTSVYGGLGGKPKAEEGVFFMWDVEKKQKVFEMIPVSGENVVSAITSSNDGLIWMMTTGHLISFDPNSKTIIHMEQLFEPLEWENRSHYWRGVYLEYDGTKHALYGNAIDKVFRYDIVSKQPTILATGGQLFARDQQGRMYYTKESELYSVTE